MSFSQIDLPTAVRFPTAAQILDAGLRYRAVGISVIPIGSEKRPATRLLPDGSWAPYQLALASEDEIRYWLSHWGPPCGLAAVGGLVSGGLEIIDFDTLDLVNPWTIKVEQRAPGLLDSLVRVQTPRPGLHVYFRSPVGAGNQKLAERLEVTPETGVRKWITTIETRGEGGYVLVPPCPPYCHPTYRCYTYITERDLTQVPTIDAKAREILLQAAIELSEAPSGILANRPRSTAIVPRPLNRALPGDDFEARTSWDALLQSHGWSFITARRETQYWCRPGKTGSVSATVNFGGSGLLYVFSTNAHPLRSDHAYTKFAFVAYCNFGGSFKSAAHALRSQGFGRQRLPYGRRRR